MHFMRGPNDDETKRGGKYVFQIDLRRNDYPGLIRNEYGVILWAYQTRPRRHIWSLLNVFGKPEFILLDPEGSDVLRIRRISRFPTCFEMTEKDQSVAKIVRRSVLRNKYSLEVKNGQGWTFRMPLFTSSFAGESTSGNLFWVQVGPSESQWNVLFQPGTENPELLAAGLAFIHWERWCYN
jgi:hypothetical protein